MAACFAGPVHAYVPVVSNVTPVLDLSAGYSIDMRGSLLIENTNDDLIIASVRSFTSPLGYAVDASREPVTARPGDTVRIPFAMSIRGDGRYHVTIPVDLAGPNGGVFGRVIGTLDVLVRDGRYSVEKYETLFVNPIDRSIDDEDGNEVLVFPAAPPPTSISLSDDFRLTRLSVEELEVPTDGAVREIGPGSGEEVQSPTLPLPPPRSFTSPTIPLPPPRSFTSARPVDPEAALYTPDAVRARLERALAAQGRTQSPSSGATFQPQNYSGLVSGMTAQGTFDYTGLDGLLHPAYGWRVYARQIIGSSAVTLAKTNVGTNGNWSMSLPAVLDVYPIEIHYEPRNIYFTLKNTAGAYYRFKSGGQYTPANNKVLNEYTQAAYLSNSDLVGLGEVHRDGMTFWNALKTRGESLDPVRDKSISLYYPNNSYDCGDGTGKPWSCANPDGNIWIIPAHAQGAVLMHELGHQLMYKFWGGSPDNAGGSHKLTKCYTTGLALSEGYADFMQVWANLGQNQDPSANGFFNLEHPENAGACTTTNKNELWVAATFWDLYDSLADGQDTIYFVHTGTPPKVFLNNGKHNTMADYLSLFKSLASPQHTTIVGNIFSQNHQ
ncbi:MAG TPA: hypothetical protein VH877_17345 [Polyangia bacterium]|nr:hypothetical protein [Polyangia bacterium]